jgi:hypothetical protein
MTFLNSIFLAGLAAVVIPLLIHFLSRRRIKIVDFSSLKFLMVMQKSKLRWLKIIELLLLIIRMMIIALIALAFACRRAGPCSMISSAESVKLSIC